MAGMYGVPADLPLDRFVGRDLEQVALGVFQVQLHFDGMQTISIEGAWELRDPCGAIVDQDQEHAERDCYRIHRVVGLPVVGFEIDPPKSFTLIFEPAYRLTVYDDMPQYEAFSIHTQGMPDIYV